MSLASQFVFLGVGFVAKYPGGGGNFSVPLQWALGLQRLRKNFIWLEILPSCGNSVEDQRRIRIFHRQLCEVGLHKNYCLILQKEPNSFETVSYYGMDENSFQQLLKEPNVLLNLCYSIKPPFLHRFDKKILCDLDPGEVPYWMQEVELGQSSHDEFWTIGLNINSPTCRLFNQSVPWKTFFPLVDTEFNQPAPRPQKSKFTTVGQWYWKDEMLLDGKWRDFSKRAVFENFLELPKKVPHARMELAMNLFQSASAKERLIMLKSDSEKERLNKVGWKVVDPHRVANTPTAYRKYISGALAEFTVVKGIDTYFQTGWLSDRAATFLALGRPVITEDTGVLPYLPMDSGMFFVANIDEAAEAINCVMREWDDFSKKARELAVEYFDAAKTLKRILG